MKLEGNFVSNDATVVISGKHWNQIMKFVEELKYWHNKVGHYEG